MQKCSPSSPPSFSHHRESMALVSLTTGLRRRKAGRRAGPKCHFSSQEADCRPSELLV